MIPELTPSESFEILSADDNSVLIDVRTNEEFIFCGFVDDSKFKNKTLLIPLKLFPKMSDNPEFAEILSDTLDDVFGKEKSRNMKIIFMCRSGARSAQAARYSYNLGYKNSYNLTHGFEGDLDRNQQRGKANGWKSENLPWKQK